MCYDCFGIFADHEFEGAKFCAYIEREKNIPMVYIHLNLCLFYLQKII